MPFIALALILAAAIGGGTSVAAQNALPGDALWGFKTQVNERVAESIAVGDEAKANWDIALAEARLDEAQKLAAENKLDANLEADLQGNFDAHARGVAERIANLQADGDYQAAADVAAKFQASVASRIQVLAQASAHANTNAQAALGVVINNVRATLDVASQLSAKATADAATHPEASTTETTNNNADTNANVQVQTGTSVKGGEGGIKTDHETGIKVGI